MNIEEVKAEVMDAIYQSVHRPCAAYDPKVREKFYKDGIQEALSPLCQALAEARKALEIVTETIQECEKNPLNKYMDSIIDAAVEWQSYWSENIHDRDGINRRQGYLYDRVRYYRKAKEKLVIRESTPPSVKEGV